MKLFLVCSKAPNWHVGIGLGNGLAPIRRQTILRTNDGIVDGYMAFMS